MSRARSKTPPVPDYIRRSAWRRRARLLVAVIFAGAVLYRIVKGFM